MDKEEEYKKAKAAKLKAELSSAAACLEAELKKLYLHKANSFFAELIRIKSIAEELKELEPTRSHFLQIGFEA